MTSFATKPEEIFRFGNQSVETRGEASADTASAAVGSSAAALPNLVDRISVSTSVLNCGDDSEGQLLEAAKSGDGRAFVELSGRYTASVRKRVFSILRNHEDTEDVLQEALFKAYTHLGQFRGSCKFSTWLNRIAINSALMQLRKRKSHSEVSLHQGGDDDQNSETWEFPDPSPNAEEVYAKRQAIDRLSYAVERLPSRYRSIVDQYHRQERTLQEAADTLGITISAAKSRLLRARLTVRSALERNRISMADACF